MAALVHTYSSPALLVADEPVPVMPSMDDVGRLPHTLRCVRSTYSLCSSSAEVPV